ncbi:MAG: C1 family peptidase [Dehalococcoidia bacterium]
MKKLVGVRVFLAIFLALILSGCGLAPLPNETGQVAPVNPEFLEFWENPPEPFYGYIPSPMDLSHLDKIPVERAVALTTIPSSFDWRAQGKVTPVKDQNPCGTCWIFGTTSVLESAVLIGEDTEYDFSEQSVALCVDRSWVCTYDDSTDPCMAGGWSWLASEVFIQKGAVLESCNPYNTGGLNCDGTCVCDGCSPIKKVNGYRLVTNDKSQTGLIKEAVYNHGPVTMAFYYDPYVHEYTYLTYGAVYDCATCAATNHIVSIIGWDDSVPHFETPGTGAWLVKNSWGTGSGNNGYLWLAYNSSCMEEIAYLKYKDYDPNETLYYWDEAGNVANFGNWEDYAGWMANIFTSTQDGELTHVDFWTTSNSAQYEIYVYLDGNIGDGLTNLATSQSGTCQELGYYSIPLDSPVPLTSGQPFTIAVKMTTPGYKYPIPVEYPLTGVDPPIQGGVSYVRCGDTDPWDDFALYGCNACLRARVTSQYNLAISSTAGGSVTGPGEGTFTYDEGTVVNLMAKAEQGYRFVNWTGDVDEIADVDAAATTITMDDDYAITANFVKTYTLTVGSTAGGSVTGPGEGTFTYDPGTVVNLVAEAEQGYRFVNWTGDVDDIADVQAATTTITMNDDYAISANFIARYDLAIVSTTGGSVTGPGEGTFTYDDGTAVNLVAEPEEGYRFVSWTGDVDDIADVQAAITTITIKGDSAITANFEEIPRYDLAVSSTAGGSVTGPGEGTFTYYEGTAVDLIAEPEEGYRFVNWTGDVDDIADVQAAATTITIKGDSTITANFEEIPRYDLAINSTASGSVTGPGEGTFTYYEGTEVDLIAEPEEGYRFVNWTGDVDDIADVQAAATTITIRGDSTIIANFEEIPQYDLAISSTDGGSVTGPGEGTFTYDDRTVVDLIAEPEEGYGFVNWTGDVDDIADVQAATTTITIRGNSTITANFIFQYELTIDSTDGGSVSEPGEGTFACDEGTVVNLVAEAEEGYRFDNWTGDIDAIDDADAAIATITMEGDYSITANFRTAGGACFIATAAYGTPMADEIETFREFRDGYLLTNPLGRAFVDFYYRVSPPLAEFITEHPSLKPMVRVALLPAVVMSTAVVNTTPVEKMAIAGLVVLVSVGVAAWATKRRNRGPEYS